MNRVLTKEDAIRLNRIRETLQHNEVKASHSTEDFNWLVSLVAGIKGEDHTTPESFEERFKETVTGPAVSALIDRGIEAYRCLTETEKKELETNINYRFPKMLLIAIGDHVLNSELGAESIMKDLTKLKRILRKRGKL